MKQIQKTNKEGITTTYKMKNFHQYWLKKDVMDKIKKLKHLYQLSSNKRITTSAFIELLIVESKFDICT